MIESPFTTPGCALIIVTHDSEQTIHKTMESLARQTVAPEKIVIVDSGSQSPSYLDRYKTTSGVHIVQAARDIGFCCANNRGLKLISPHIEYVFLLNPDAFLSPTYIEQAIAFMKNPLHASCAALSGTLLGYDIQADQPRGQYDSRGVFRTWYGRWYDRDQGQSVRDEAYQNETLHENVPALCGAAFFCRRKALDQVLIRENELLDETFFMYKEDIDLSLRLRKKGWTLAFLPALYLYHCRGWAKNRSRMPRRLRLCSARNELRMHWKEKQFIPVIYSTLKFASVKVLNV